MSVHAKRLPLAHRHGYERAIHVVNGNRGEERRANDTCESVALKVQKKGKWFQAFTTLEHSRPAPIETSFESHLRSPQRDGSGSV